MSWQYFILGNAFLVAISLLAIRAIARQPKMAHAGIAVNGIGNAFLYLVGLCLIPALGSVNIFAFNQYWPWFLGAGISFAVTNVTTYKALTYLDAGIVAVLGTCSSLTTLALAYVFLGESLSYKQAIGSVILLFAVCYIVLATSHYKKYRSSKKLTYGTIFTLMAAIFFGISAVTEKYLLQQMNPATYVAFGWAGQSLAAITLAVVFQRDKIRPLLKTPYLFKLVGLAGITRGLGGICFILALVRSNNVALMTIINNFRLIFVVLLSAWLLSEKNLLFKKLVSAGLAITGMAIIFWK